jgi:hypothetical protein
MAAVELVPGALWLAADGFHQLARCGQVSAPVGG